MRKKKDNPPKKEYMFDEPTCIDSGEIRIIDDCAVILNAPVTVYGTLIFHNCSVSNQGAIVTVYGSLKMDKCHIISSPKPIQIKNGGKLFLDSFPGSIELEDLFLREEYGCVKLLPYPISEEDRFNDLVISRVSQFYGIPQKEIYSRTRTDKPEENEIRREAWFVAIYLRRELTDMSPGRFISQFNCPIYLGMDEIERAKKFVKNGDMHLWRNVAEILAKIIQEMYANNLAYENSHPYKDLV